MVYLIKFKSKCDYKTNEKYKFLTGWFGYILLNSKQNVFEKLYANDSDLCKIGQNPMSRSPFKNFGSKLEKVVKAEKLVKQFSFLVFN